VNDRVRVRAELAARFKPAIAAWTPKQGHHSHGSFTHMRLSGSCTPVYLCSCLHIANVGGARRFSLMSFLSGARLTPNPRGAYRDQCAKNRLQNVQLRPVLIAARLAYRRWLALSSCAESK